MVRVVFASLIAVAAAQLNSTSLVCPFSGGLTKQPGLPPHANCPNGVSYVEGSQGKYTLRTPDSGACGFGVLGGDCGAMRLGDIDRIEFDVSVSAECQSQGCGGSKGDWVAVWLDPHSGWNKDREVDMMETVFGKGDSYVKTNFAGSVDSRETDWGASAPFAQHVTMTGADNAKGGRDVYVAHCAKGSDSCKTGPGVNGNAHKANMEREIVYRLVVDNWGNTCGRKGATPGCSVTVENVKVTLASSPGPSPSPTPTPTPSPPSPSPSPGQWAPCSGGGKCCNPHSQVAQYCPSGDKCQECGGGDACRCPSATETEAAVLV
jgi:hypothetical protein